VISVRRSAKAASDTASSVAPEDAVALLLRQDAPVGEVEATRTQALLEELRRAVRGAGVPADEWSRARAEAVDHARVSPDRHAGTTTPLPAPKRILRRLLRWYVEPVFDDQRLFNEALLRLLDDLHEQVTQLERELERRRGNPT
jgi:hypothetical protein